MDELNLHSEHGGFKIMTGYVLVRKVFLSLVLLDGMPFDMVITDTEDEARKAHKKFDLGAQIMASLMATQVSDIPADRNFLN